MISSKVLKGKYGVKMAKGDLIEQVNGLKSYISGMCAEAINNGDYADVDVIEFAWRGCTEYATTYVCEYKVSDSGLNLYRPNMQWLIEQESKTQQEGNKMKNLLTPDQELALAEIKSDMSNMQKDINDIANSTTPTETPEEKEALDKVDTPQEAYIKYDVQTKEDLIKAMNGNVKPIFTQEMADKGELPPVGSEVLLRELTGFYNVASGNVSELKEGDKVLVVGHTIELDTHFPNLVLHGGKRLGFVALNPNYVAPLQTEREKAIDELTIILSSSEAATAIYNNGYRKVK